MPGQWSTSSANDTSEVLGFKFKASDQPWIWGCSWQLRPGPLANSNDGVGQPHHVFHMLLWRPANSNVYKTFIITIIIIIIIYIYIYIHIHIKNLLTNPCWEKEMKSRIPCPLCPLNQPSAKKNSQRLLHKGHIHSHGRWLLASSFGHRPEEIRLSPGEWRPLKPSKWWGKMGKMSFKPWDDSHA